MRPILGELIGTFTIVLIGALSVLFNALNLYEVAILFGLGVTISILLVHKFSHAHLNPAVSLAFLVRKHINIKQFFWYSSAQTIGAILGGFTVYFMFQSSILEFEQTNHILRGSNGSHRSAVMFGEYFPNPGFASEITISTINAGLLEMIGTFVLILVIFILTDYKKIKLTPLYIGLTVSILIIVIAPYTQAGFNPARDFGPRVSAFLNGWKHEAFSISIWHSSYVYIISPMLGGLLAVGVNKLMKKT